MNRPPRRIRSILLGIVLFVPSSLATIGCGDTPQGSAPADFGAKKTPTQILEEAKAQDKAAKP